MEGLKPQSDARRTLSGPPPISYIYIYYIRYSEKEKRTGTAGCSGARESELKGSEGRES